MDREDRGVDIYRVLDAYLLGETMRARLLRFDREAVKVSFQK